MKHAVGVAVVCGAMLAGAWPGEVAAAAPGQGDVARGEYLAMFGGCHDCHSPKTLTPTGPTLDTSRLLSGHRAEWKLPPFPSQVLGRDGWGAVANHELTAWAGPWGVSFAANLTPDRTGIGGWTEQQFIQTMRTGKHLGVGRQILPPMPWQQIGQLTDADLKAIFEYLKSLKPIDNLVPQPLPPQQ